MRKYILETNRLTVERARRLRKEMTNAERKLWSFLRDDQLGVRFRRQAPIGPYIADFVCVKARLVIELDGPQHYTPEGITHDKKRDAYLRGRGLIVKRYKSEEFLRHTDAVVDEIRRSIGEVQKQYSVSLSSGADDKSGRNLTFGMVGDAQRDVSGDPTAAGSAGRRN